MISRGKNKQANKSGLKDSKQTQLGLSLTIHGDFLFNCVCV